RYSISENFDTLSISYVNRLDDTCIYPLPKQKTASILTASAISRYLLHFPCFHLIIPSHWFSSNSPHFKHFSANSFPVPFQPNLRNNRFNCFLTADTLTFFCSAISLRILHNNMYNNTL